MAGQHDGAAVGAELADELADLDHTGRIQAVGRLVEKDELRIAEESEGDTEALLHAERVRRELAVGALAEIDELQQPIDVGRRAALADGLEVAEVRAPGEVRIERRCLDHRANTAQRRRVERGVAEDVRLAGCGVHQPEQHAHRGRLPRAVGAEEAEDAAARHFQRELVDGHDIAVALRQRGRLDDVVGAISPMPIPSSGSRFYVGPRRVGGRSDAQEGAQRGHEGAPCARLAHQTDRAGQARGLGLIEASQQARPRRSEVKEHGTAVGRVRVPRDQTLPHQAVAERRRAREAHAQGPRKVADAQRLPAENEERTELGECEVHVGPSVRRRGHLLAPLADQALQLGIARGHVDTLCRVNYRRQPANSGRQCQRGVSPWVRPPFCLGEASLGRRR